MAVLTKKPTDGAKKLRRGSASLPTKRTINLIGIGEKHINLLIAIPAIVLIIGAAFLISKFLVLDRLSELSAAESKVAAAQSQLDDGYRKIDSYGDLVEIYAHYTYSGMTAEELHRVDRVEIIEMIQRVILSSATLDNWNIKGNTLTVVFRAGDLQQINTIVQQLNAEEMVNYCSVTTASTYETRDVWGNEIVNPDAYYYTGVTANVIVYLNDAEGVNGK